MATPQRPTTLIDYCLEMMQSPIKFELELVRLVLLFSQVVYSLQ